MSNKVEPAGVAGEYRPRPAESGGSSKFLGAIDKRYIRTPNGVLHALSSIAALAIGNCLFFRNILLRCETDPADAAMSAFLWSSLVSGATLVPFWGKVQSWQLSTTTMEQKGLSPRQMQRFNRGRGVLAPILAAAYPLMYCYLPEETLEDAIFGRVAGTIVLLATMYQFVLIRDYGKPLWIIYGGSKFGFSLHLLWSGSLAAIRRTCPYAIVFLEKEALFVVCCVEYGFLWFYLYSRQLATKNFVQKACKRYHPIMLYFYVVHMTIEEWWRHLPVSLSWVMIVSSVAMAKTAKSGPFKFESDNYRPKRRRSSIEMDFGGYPMEDLASLKLDD